MTRVYISADEYWPFFEVTDHSAYGNVETDVSWWTLKRWQRATRRWERTQQEMRRVRSEAS